LHYPITVTELLKQKGDEVQKFQPLFAYVYKTTVTEGNEFGEEFQVVKTFPTRFESETDGTIVSWKISKGTIINGPEYVRIRTIVDTGGNKLILWILVSSSSRSRSHASTKFNSEECARYAART